MKRSNKEEGIATPQFTTARTQYYNRLDNIDDILYGGVETKAVTEFYGAPGSGKTQLCHTMCANVPQDKSKDNKVGQLTLSKIRRAENIRFKAPIHKMPSKPVDWPKVEMHNWSQYTTVVGSVKVKLNHGEKPTIEFLPAAIDGSDPLQLYLRLFSECNEVAKHLEQILDMQIGRLEVSSKGEWVIYNPLAKAITNIIGRVTVEGIGKINASLPNRYGEFEFHDPRAAAEFLVMPRRLARLEQDVKEVLDLVKQQARSYSEDKGNNLVGDTPNEEV